MTYFLHKIMAIFPEVILYTCCNQCTMIGSTESQSIRIVINVLQGYVILQNKQTVYQWLHSSVLLSYSLPFPELCPWNFIQPAVTADTFHSLIFSLNFFKIFCKTHSQIKFLIDQHSRNFSFTLKQNALVMLMIQ